MLLDLKKALLVGCISRQRQPFDTFIRRLAFKIVYGEGFVLTSTGFGFLYRPWGLAAGLLFGSMLLKPNI